MTKHIDTESHFTLKLTACYGQNVEVEFGQISLVPARCEYDLDQMLTAAQGICKAANYGGALYRPAKDDDDELVAIISEADFEISHFERLPTPEAPYAVYRGLPGYLPNSLDHFRDLRDGLEHFANELEAAIDQIIGGDTDISDDHELLAFIQNDLEVVQTALRAHGEPIHPEHQLKFGYHSHVSTYEVLTISPIAPEDYNPEQTND
jgi:hypothetical protein